MQRNKKTQKSEITESKKKHENVKTVSRRTVGAEIL